MMEFLEEDQRHGPRSADPHRIGPAVSNSPAICKDHPDGANPPLLSFRGCTTSRKALRDGGLALQSHVLN